jgi:acetate kinase
MKNAAMNAPLVITVNTGSSSLKFALYDATEPMAEARFQGSIRDIGRDARFELRHCPDANAGSWRVEANDHREAMTELLRWLEQHPYRPEIAAAGHRVVHGGELFSRPVLLNTSTLRQLEALVPLAPLHMPHNLAAVDVLSSHYPGIPQVACFDTAFHHDMPPVERYFAIPHQWQDMGIRRYGFHGLSYEYIAEVLPDHMGKAADGRIIVAHLGNGASLCAMHGRRSMATTMSFTPLDGVPMATRPGSLDPGAVLYLQQQGLSTDTLSRGLNFESGLLGLSGISGDMRTLLASHQPAARLAVDYFIHHVNRAIGSLAAALGGLDALVFTAGIGENAPRIRQRLCDLGSWLGLALDNEANVTGRGRISPRHAEPSVWVIPTNEELMVARHTIRLAGGLIQRREERR